MAKKATQQAGGKNDKSLDKQRLMALQEFIDAEKALNAARIQGTDNVKKLQQAYGKAKDKLKAITAEQNKLNTALKEEEETYKSIGSNIASLSGIQKEFGKDLKKTAIAGLELSQSIAASVVAGDKNTTGFKQSADYLAAALDLTADIASLNADDVVEMRAKTQEYERVMKSLGDSITDLQALGGKLTETQQKQLAALESQQKAMGHIFAEASSFGNMSKETKELYEELFEDLESINKTFKKISTTAEVFFSSFQNAIGVAFVGAGHLFEKFEEINSQIGGWGFQLGGFKLQAMLVTEILGEEAGKATISLGQKLGNVNDVTLGTSLNAGFLAHNLGLSGDEAAGVITQFGRLQGLSNDTGLNMAAATKELALQNGVAPRQVMQDIAKNGEAFALFSKDGGKNMAEAAVAAAKLGSDLGTASKMSENLLDYNNSIEKEMNASVLLGRDLNLGKARELAYAGDIAGAQKAALEAAGGVQEFNKMDYYQKKAVADALGVSVQELQTMGANMEHNNTLTGQLEGTFSALNEGAEALTGTFGGTLLKGIGGALIGVKGMKENLADAKEGASFLKDSFTGIKGLFSGKGMKGFSGILESKEQKSIGGLGDKLTGSKDGAPPQAPSGDQAGQASKFGKINATEMIKAAAALLIIAAAVWVFAKALQEFAGVDFGAALMGIGLLILLAVVAALLGTVAEFLILGAIGLAAVSIALLIFGAAVNVLGAGMILLGEGFASMAAGIKDLDVGKLALFGLALIPLGIGLLIAAPGLIIGSVGLMLLANAMAALAPALSLLSTVMPAIVANLTPLVGMIMQIFGLAAAITTLSLSLAMLGTMGILALPILAALGGGGLMKVLGGGEGGSKKEDSSQKLLDEIVGLRQDMTDGKIAVYLDGKKMNTGLAISNKRQPS